MKKNNSLIPFDLKRALAGEKVITRDGQEIQQIFYCDKANENTHKLVVVINSFLYLFNEDGKLNVGTAELDLDLFMAPKIKKLYIGVSNIQNEMGFYNTSYAYEDEMSASCHGMPVHEIEVKLNC